MARKRRREPQAALVSNPTPERMARAGQDYETGGDRASSVVVTMRDSPLERLERRKQITSKQYDAGVKFRHHWYHAGMAGRVGSVDLHKVLSHPSAGSRCDLHGLQYREAIKTLGLITSALVEAVVCYERTLENVAPDLGRHPGGYGLEVVTKQLSAALDKLVDLWQL